MAKLVAKEDIKTPPIPMIPPSAKTILGLIHFCKLAPTGLNIAIARAQRGTTAKVEYQSMESPI